MIVGDQQILAVGVRNAIEEDGLEVVGLVRNPVQARSVLGRTRPDLCVVLAPVSGGVLPIIADLHEATPGLRVVVLSSEDHVEGETLLAAMSAGADGWLSLDLSPHVLGRTLRAVHRGEPAISREHVTRLLEALRRPAGRVVRLADGRTVEFTPREHESFLLVAEGLSTRAIAERLGVSVATVRWHVAGLMKKLDVRSRDEAVALACVPRRRRRLVNAPVLAATS